MLGWVGRGKDLRIASYDGTGVLKNRSLVTTPVDVQGAPSLSSQGSDDYVSFRGTDGNVYFGYSQGCRPSCFQISGTISDQGSGGVGHISDGPIVIAYFDATGHLNIT
jgi:hypothetical protein